jgi:lysophospholipase L1-like esterase
MSAHEPIPALNSDLPDRRPRFWGAVRKLAVHGVVILIVAGVLELAVRNLDPRYTTHLFNADYSGGFPNAINADGFRGPPALKERSDREYRLLGAGDSVTFGTGVPAEATWPLRLQSLAWRSDRPMTVINAGVPAASVKDIAFALRTRWKDLKPDGVILPVTGNMVALAWIRRGDQPVVPEHEQPSDAVRASKTFQIKSRVQKFVRSFALPSFLTINVERGLYWLGLIDHEVNPDAPFGALFAQGWRQLDLDPARVDEAWTLFGAELADLAATCRELKIPVFITYIPSRFTLSDSIVDNEKNVPKQRLTIDPGERLQALAKDVGVSFLDMKLFLNVDREQNPRASRYRQFDYTHLDVHGHDVVARGLAIYFGPSDGPVPNPLRSPEPAPPPPLGTVPKASSPPEPRSGTPAR